MSDLPSYAPASPLHTYDPETNMYGVREDVLAVYSAALGGVQAGTGLLNIAAVGDSGLVGYDGSGTGSGATGYKQANSIPKQFAAELAAAVDAVWPGVQGIDIAMKAAFTSVGDTWVTTGAINLPLSAQLGTFSGVGTDEYTSVDKGTAVDILYSDLSTPFTYQIDGGTAVAVTPTNTPTVKKISVTGLASATHKAKFNFSTAYGIDVAARVYTPNAPQISVHNLALGGSWANGGGNPGKDWNDNTLAAGHAGLAGTSGALMAAAGIVPDLVICSVGNNDQAGASPTATIMTGITNIRNLWPSASFCLIHAYMVSGANTTTFDALGTAKWNYCDTDGAFLYDWNHAVGGRTGAAANGRIGADGNHPKVAEQVRVGRHMARALGDAA